MKKIFTLSFVLLITLVLSQQRTDFLQYPKIQKADLSKTKSAIDPNAAAEILYKSAHFHINASNSTLDQEVYAQIKIYDKNRAEDFLTVQLNLMRTHDQEENLRGLEARTYNLEDQKITSDKVQSDAKFKSKEGKNFFVQKFTFPNVKNGSILEYRYTISSPFYWYVPTSYIEEPIPVVYTEFVFDRPMFFGYNINYTGDVAPTKRYIGKEKLYGLDSETYRFGFTNLKPFDEESFVLNSNNYKTKVSAELSSVAFPDGEIKNFARTWDDIRKQLLDDADFGNELKRKLPSDFISADILAIKDPLTKTDKILKLAQQSFKWDGTGGITADNGSLKLIKSKSGNVADINLTLIKMLREAGIKTYPVVLSTVDNGKIGYFPSTLGLNYIIAAVEIGDQLHLLDATNRQSQIDVMPPRVYNERGFILMDDAMREVPLNNNNLSEDHMTVHATLNPGGAFQGSVVERESRLFAMLSNDQYDDDKDAYEKNYQKPFKFKITNLKSGLLENNDFETSFDFSADNLTETIGDKMIINPLLFLFSEKNPFSEKDPRTFPVEFVTAYTKIRELNIKLPEGFVVENLPKPYKINTDDQQISYFYEIKQDGNQLNVKVTTTIQDSNYPKEYYPAFRQIWNAIVKRESNLVTIVKKG